MASPATTRAGRIVPVVVNDDESELRTPAQPLYIIPREARDSFAPHPPPLSSRMWSTGWGSSACDLTRIAAGRPRAQGQVIEIAGRVLDEDARPVRETLIEIWNANTHGRYSHTLDSGNTDSPLDPNFYGFGRLLTDAKGCYRLRTIKPGAYIARREIQWWRPPHVHFSIVGNGLRLVTQMYFPDEPLNARDFIHLYVPEDDRRRVIGVPVAGSDDTTSFRFDIVIRGRFQTPPDND
jgi:protocatechuate 3,4-dioxygenase, beta subunit